MSHRITSIVSSLTFLAACLINLALVSAQANGQDRAFAGRASGAIVGQIPPNGLLVSYTGNGTHLGRFTREETIFVNADGSVSGHLVFYAANGDQLRANVSGQFTSQSTVTGHYQFAGGTGRFAAATGQAEFAAVTPDGTNVDVIFSGRINY